MNEAFKRILDEAVTKIDEADKKSREVAVQAKKDLRALADFAEALPKSILLDTMTALATAEFNFQQWNSYPPSLYIGGQQNELEGGLRKELKGKYRAIVILQRME